MAALAVISFTKLRGIWDVFWVTIPVPTQKPLLAFYLGLVPIFVETERNSFNSSTPQLEYSVLNQILCEIILNTKGLIWICYFTSTPRNVCPLQECQSIELSVKGSVWQICWKCRQTKVKGFNQFISISSYNSIVFICHLRYVSADFLVYILHSLIESCNFCSVKSTSWERISLSFHKCDYNLIFYCISENHLII